MFQGPVFPSPLQDPSEIDNLKEEGAVDRLLYVGKAITLTRHRIEGKVPLIGFTGAPVSWNTFKSLFIINSYLIKNIKS